MGILPINDYICAMKEIWKKIEGQENYSVSNMGRIRNDVRGNYLNGSLNGRGYLTTCIGKKHYKFHRLVAEHFIPNPENLPEVNHLNGIKSDCKFTNLEWSTSSDNSKHAVRLGLKKGKKGITNPSVKLSEIEVLDIVQLSRKGTSQNELARIFNCHQTTISSIVTGKIWTELTGIKKEKSYGKR